MSAIISYLRTAVSYLAVTELGDSAAEVGRKLGISHHQISSMSLQGYNVPRYRLLSP